MAWFVPFFGVAAAASIGGLVKWRANDTRDDLNEMARLAAMQPSDPPPFALDSVADLPEPARRYFAYLIAEGTPTWRVAELEMEGEFGMGDNSSPNYLDMEATQVLAAPHGFVWKMRAGRGAFRMSGSDSASWTRFWLAGVIPVARLGGTLDHRRAAFGRYVAEAAFWTPAAFLPGPGVSWKAVADDCARVTVDHDGLSQSVDIFIARDGRPIRVEFDRWSDANPEKTYRIQRFGGYLSEFEQFDGFTLPTRVEAGNFFGSDDYFAFFKAKVTAVRFPKA
ncbi:DUF6544 family protein [Erythrobacter sp. JK5]|uniref:DUF6544 family protein n=1 Tax=Erythrobacter sp. JK5 TaxID=2829500 RepID=UPI001BAD401B|nr:DUF6544 family protein [Erythrobacter sp. JK5]QUL38911.1 hypothetical protein KDC96_06030 [Erythrobacter sp. JK5]